MSDPIAIKEIILYAVYPICTFIVSGAGWAITNRLKTFMQKMNSVEKQVVELRVETLQRLSVVETKIESVEGYHAKNPGS